MSAGVDPQRVRDLFEQVCDLPRDEQLTRIESLCAGENTLREELLSLLEHDAESDDLFSESMLGSQRENLLSPRESLPIPQRIGEFRVVRRIGSGGMGDVYEAEQDSPRRRVALKMMRPGVMSPRLESRFRREAQILASLKHPGIAQLYVTGIHELGGAPVPYFAMELVEGAPLTEFSDSRGLSVRERLKLMIRIGDAVQAAHDQGVIHRDLKPDNILIVDDSNGPRPKILDFGVAKLTETDVTLATVQTEVGQLVGTLSYMSPEQIDGDPTKLDARTDVHALGVILYELLAGERAFDLAGLPIHVAARIVKDEEPSALATIDRIYRGDVDTIVRRAIEKEPDRRYASVRALVDDLRRYLESKPIEARPPTTMYQLGKFARRNKALVAGAAATFAALIVGLVGTTWFAIDAMAEQRESRWQFYRSSISAASNALVMMQPDGAEALLRDAPAEYRDWEWRFLSTKHDGLVEPFGPETCVQVAADAPGGRVAVLSGDGSLGLWDADTGEPIRTVNAADDLVEISRRMTGGLVLGVSRSCGIVLIDVVNDRLVREYEADEGAAFPRLSEGGERAAWANGGVVRVVDARTGSTVYRGDPFEGDDIQSLTLSPDGSTLALTCDSVHHFNNALLVDVETGALSSRRNPERPLNAEFSPDGGLVVFTMTIRNAQVYAVDGFSPIASLRGHNKRVTDASFLDEGRVVTVAEDLSVRTWDARSGRRLRVVPFPERVDPSPSVRFAGGDSVLAVAAEGERLWRVGIGAESNVHVLPHEDYVYQIAFSPDSRRLAVSPKQGRRITIWDTGSVRESHRIEGAAGDLFGMSFSHDGEHFVGSQRDAEGHPVMHLWRTGDWARIQADVSPDEVAAVFGSARGLRLSKRDCASPDGRTRVLMTNRVVFHGRSREWKVLRDGVEATPAALDDPQIEAVAWSPDGALLAGASLDSEAIVWRAGSMSRVATLEHASPVMAVAFHPSGSRIATGGEDGIVRLWDTDRWELVLELHGHESYVFDLQFSPDGRSLASASGDATVRLWDAGPREDRPDSTPR